MTAPELTERERLAAEHALRLLEGEELVMARGLAASDPDFAREVSEWEERLAPLQDELAGVEPGADLWDRIQAQLDGGTPAAEVTALRKRVRQWQIASLVSAAAAIALAFLAIPAMQQAPVAPQPGEPLMANIPIGDTSLRLAVTYLPDRSEMLVSASGLTADGVHDHELWLVPPQGELRSLGVVKPGEEVRMPLDPDLASLIRDGSEMLLTREPLGGKPADEAAGPVVAQGAFSLI